jgi:hypothetical protein
MQRPAQKIGSEKAEQAGDQRPQRPTGKPSSRRAAQARAATIAVLVASTTTAKAIVVSGDDCAASISFQQYVDYP